MLLIAGILKKIIIIIIISVHFNVCVASFLLFFKHPPGAHKCSTTTPRKSLKSFFMVTESLNGAISQQN